MDALFDDARDEVKAALLRVFAKPLSIQLPSGQAQTISGYIRSAETNGHVVRRLLTDANVATQSAILLEQVRYRLSFNGPQEGKGSHDSQLIREYVLVPEQQGDCRDWSEFRDGA